MIEQLVQLDTNVDDMDPRLWPRVIDQLLAAGALDAWVTPIIMKKGRPAFTLSALASDTTVDDVRRAIYNETSTIGVRQQRVDRHSLDRVMTTVEVHGQAVAIKVSSLDGVEMNRSVEWNDVITAADALGMSAKDVLAAAQAASVDGLA